MKTRILEDVYQRAILEMKKERFVKLISILELSKHMQRNEMDTHIVVAGQNGTGKTVLVLGLMSVWYNNDEAVLSNLMTAENTTSDLVTYILENELKLCGIDELNIFLDYKQHMDVMQRHLITSLELARSKRIVYVGCARDPRKLALNYRNGKMSIVLWVIDRFEEGGAYAAVCIAPASIEAADRFGFENLPEYIGDFDSLRFYMERLPSFVGWLKIDDVKSLVHPGLLERYKEKKNTAMAYAHVNKLIDLNHKGKISDAEFTSNIEKLKKILGDEAITAVLDKRATVKKSRRRKADEGDI